MLETYLKQITYYKVNVNGLRLRSEVTAVHFGLVMAKVMPVTYGMVWP